MSEIPSAKNHSHSAVSRRLFLRISLIFSSLILLAAGSTGYYTFRNRKSIYYKYIHLGLTNRTGLLNENEMETILTLSKIIFPTSPIMSSELTRSYINDRTQNFQGFIGIYKMAVKFLDILSLESYNQRFNYLDKGKKSEVLHRILNDKVDLSLSPLEFFGWPKRVRYLIAQITDRQYLLIRKYVINDLKFIYYREKGSEILGIDYSVGEPEGIFYSGDNVNPETKL